MEEYAALKSLVVTLEDDLKKFYAGNAAAGTRARSQLLEARKLVNDLRQDIQRVKNERKQNG